MTSIKNICGSATASGCSQTCLSCFWCVMLWIGSQRQFLWLFIGAHMSSVPFLHLVSGEAEVSFCYEVWGLIHIGYAGGSRLCFLFYHFFIVFDFFVLISFRFSCIFCNKSKFSINLHIHFCSHFVN